MAEEVPVKVRLPAALLLFLVTRNFQADLITCWNVTSEDGLATTSSVDNGLGVIFLEPQDDQSPAGLLAIITGTSVTAGSGNPTASALSPDIVSDVLPART